MQNRLSIRGMRTVLNAAFVGFGLTYLQLNSALAESAGHMDKHEATSHAADAAHHGESSGGLPQLDPSTYPSQIFWLVIAFVLLYFFFSSKTLPEVSSVLEKRKDRISNDLGTAEQLKEEIEEAQTTYEDSLSGARDKAAKTLADTNAKIAEKAAKETEKLNDKAVKEINALESEIQKAKQAAMDDISSVVAEVSHEAAQKIVGMKLDPKKAQTVVKALNEKKAA